MTFLKYNILIMVLARKKYLSKIDLNNIDLAWLRMENPTNPMMITVVLLFKGEINHDRLITTLDGSFNRFRRFRQRIVRPGGFFSRPYWEDDPHYRVEDHVERLHLQLPADEKALWELVSIKMASALDFAHPLWKITLVDNYPEGSILIIRAHHCIADGISLMRILLMMSQTSPDGPANQVPVDNPDGDKTQIDRELAFSQTASQVSERGPASSPARTGKQAPDLFKGTLYENRTLTEIIAAMLRILFLRPDPPTIFKGPLGKIKKAVWSEPYNLAEIKNIARIKQATPNDVLMAVASGAIRRYLDLHQKTRKRNIRAFILYNLRRRFLDEELGNKFGLVFLTLPLDRELSIDRLGAIKQGMDNLKSSAEYAATYQILNILGTMPEWIEHLATVLLDTKGTVVATNVAGPRRQLFLAGAPIQSIIAWVPQAGRIGVGLSFITYNNQVRVGINTDAGLVPNPEKFIELFAEEFKSFQTILSTVTNE
jgi:diacylglycerol O-acyltransferase / wax synthase